MGQQFHLDIITPTSIKSFDKVAYVRIPSIEGLIGIQARHAQAIIALDIGEIKIIQDGKPMVYATSGGFADIAKEGVQLLLETVELSNLIDLKRAKESLHRAKSRLKESTIDLDRASLSIKRAKNRLDIIKKFNGNK